MSSWASCLRIILRICSIWPVPAFLFLRPKGLRPKVFPAKGWDWLEKVFLAFGQNRPKQKVWDDLRPEKNQIHSRGSSVVEQRIENPCVTSSILVPGKKSSGFGHRRKKDGPQTFRPKVGCLRPLGLTSQSSEPPLGP